MRFAVLGSGSRGNALLVEAGTTRVLVDCGYSIAETERRLARLGRCAQDLSAILVTHEHTDHIGGVAALARKYRLEVWMTHGTRDALAARGLASARLYGCHEPFVLRDMEVCPFPVPHDAREPAQFVIGDGAVRLGIVTDVGAVTPHMVTRLCGVDALVLECNHDPGMLADGPYPPSLKQRVAGRYGHLSNPQAADLLARLDRSRLQHVVAAHLSEKNNTPQRARAALAGALGCTADWICVADQEAGLGWCEVK